jgi:hypothetical protein
MKNISALLHPIQRIFISAVVFVMASLVVAAPPAGWRTDPTPSVSPSNFMAFSGVNVHFDYFSYGWAIGGVPPGWGYNPSGFSSAWGSQKWRDWLTLCADNNIQGIRIMSPFGDGRNLFDASGNISIDETRFLADLLAFFRIVEEVELQRNVRFKIIFTFFDFRIADGEWIAGLGEHPEILDPTNPKRVPFLNLFRDKFFKVVYDPAPSAESWGVVRENRIVWQLVNEFVSMKPDTGGRSEDDAMEDPAYRQRREELYGQGKSFFLAFRDMIKTVNPTALVGISDLGAENTILRWQNKGFDLLDYHTHPDYLKLNGNIGTTLKNVGWNGIQPLIEGEAYIPGWRSVNKSVLVERLRASYNRGSRGAMFWWDGWYRFDPSVYATVTTGDLAFVPSPDLVVESIAGPDRPVEGANASYSVTVGNWGTVSAGESVLKLQMDGSYLTQYTVPPLSPGQSYSALAVNWSATPGHHRFLAEADNWFHSTESDEDNNNVTKHLVVVAPLADLVVEKVEGTEGLVAGNPTVFKVTVANRGGAVAGEIALKFQVDGQEIATVIVRPLAPGEAVVSSVNWIPVAGVHTLLVEADNWQKVAETNESNNKVSTPLSVGASTLLYSQYFGGAGNSSILDAVSDGAGNTIVVGETSTGGHPVTSGSWDTTYNGGTLDGFVAKFSPTGSLLFCTYLGGSGEDSALGVALDSAGNILVTGKTYSTNFPTTVGAYDRTLGGQRDAFLVKMSPDGRSVLYGTYLGGANWDYGFQVAEAPGGDMIVAGFTHGGYPVTTGAAQTVFGGMGDGFVTRVKASGKTLAYSSYVGGESWDGVAGLAVDALGQVYLSGDTHSKKFPTTAGAFDRSCSNCSTNYSTDGFITKLSATGDRWIYSTFIGGAAAPASENLRRIVVGLDGTVTAVGTSTGGDFPVTADAAKAHFSGGADLVVVKLSADGSTLLYGSYLGGGGRDTAMDVVSDGAGGVVVAGVTDSSNFPVTPDAAQLSRRGSTDAFLVKIKPGAGIVYGTYWGGSGTELDGLALTKDGTGQVLLAGGTSSTNLPTFGVPASAPYGGGSSDGYLSVFKGIALPDVIPPPKKPSGTKLVSRDGHVVLTWKNNGNYPGTTYQVYSSTGYVYQLKMTTQLLEMTPSLVPGMTHFFKVRARNSAKVVSGFDVVVSTKIPAGSPFASSSLGQQDSPSFAVDRAPFNVWFSVEQAPDVSILLDPREEEEMSSPLGERVGHPWLVSLDGTESALVRVSPSFPASDARYTVVRWHEDRSTWEEIPPGEAIPPGLFAVRRGIPPSVGSAKIYPNPFRPTRGHSEVKIEVPLGSTVRLYTLTGERVRDLVPDSSGVAHWRGDNDAGLSVASGVYFCFIAKEGDKKIFRLAVEQ